MNRQHFVLLTISIFALMGLVYSMGFAQEEPPKRTPEEILAIIAGNASDYYLPGYETDNAASPPNVIAGSTLPDWSRLAFETFRDDNWEIYLYNILTDGSNQFRVTNHPNLDVHPSLNRGATQMLFASTRDGEHEIYKVNSDGSNLVQLTNNLSADVLPTWSPDGSKIAFQSDLAGNFDIYTMNVDGTGLTQLTNSSEIDAMPSWSPDGSKLLFASYRTGTYDLWVMNADGTNQVALNIGFYALYPAWSPIGDQIAFVGDSDADGFFEIWTANSDGSNPVERLHNGSQIDAWFPAWSPDGKWLAYTWTRWIIYQGNYYWTTSYLGAFTLDAFDGVSLASTDNRVWRSSWASKDLIPPDTCTVTAPLEQKWTSFAISFTASDLGGSGISSYDVQARWGENGSWRTVITKMPFSSSIFNGSQSGKVDFRCRARDITGNIAPWPDTPSASTIIDAIRPESWVKVEQPLVQETSSTISWMGQDVEGGIASYDIYVKDGTEGDWTLWQDHVTTTSAVYMGIYGHTYFFRSQATDEVGHIETWKPVPDTSVTFYATRLSGLVTDARGNVLSQPFFQTAPMASEMGVDPIHGYQLYLSDAITHSLVITANGFAPLDSTILETTGDATFGWVLTSEKERVANGNLETGGLDGWNVSGLGVQTNTDSHHSGEYGLQFEQSITSTMQITQSLLIPAEDHEPTLSFLYQIPSDLESGNFEVFLKGPTSQTVLSTTIATNGWAHLWTDLSAFAGETVTLIFRFDAIGSVKVDEISVGPWETPRILSVSPASVLGWEDSSLVITGENFIQMPTVFLNGNISLEVTWDSPTQLLVTVPAGLERGTYDIQLVNPNGAMAILPEAVSITWNLIYLPITTNNANSFSNLENGAADWPTLGQNNAHTGVNTNDPGASRYALAWTKPLPYVGSEILQSLAIADGVLVVADNVRFANSAIIALNAYTGEELWQYPFADKYSINPASIAHGLVYFQEGKNWNDSFLFALDLYSGEKMWQSPFSAQWETYLPPVVTDTSVFINAGSNGGLYAYNAGSGELLWYSYMDQFDDWTPAYLNKRLFAFVYDSFMELDHVIGDQLWHKTVSPTTSNSMYTAPVLTEQTALLANNAGLFAIDINTHQIKWSVSGDFYKTIPTTDGTLVYALREGKLQVRNVSNGSLVWSFDGDSLLTNAPVIAGNYVYVASPENTYVLDRTTHQMVWQIEHGGWLAVANGFLYIGTPDETIYAYQAQEP